MKAKDRSILKSAGMPEGKIREVDTWIRKGRKVVVKDRDIFTIEAETGSLEVLEL